MKPFSIFDLKTNLGIGLTCLLALAPVIPVFAQSVHSQAPVLDLTDANLEIAPLVYSEFNRKIILQVFEPENRDLYFAECHVPREFRESANQAFREFLTHCNLLDAKLNLGSPENTGIFQALFNSRFERTFNVRALRIQAVEVSEGELRSELRSVVVGSVGVAASVLLLSEAWSSLRVAISTRHSVATSSWAQLNMRGSNTGTRRSNLFRAAKFGTVGAVAAVFTYAVGAVQFDLSRAPILSSQNVNLTFPSIEESVSAVLSSSETRELRERLLQAWPELEHSSGLLASIYYRAYRESLIETVNSFIF